MPPYCQLGCEGYTNRSFGHLEIGSNRGSSSITCTFLIGRGDINQAVAVIWIQDLYLSHYRYNAGEIIISYYLTPLSKICLIVVLSLATCNGTSLAVSHWAGNKGWYLWLGTDPAVSTKTSYFPERFRLYCLLQRNFTVSACPVAYAPLDLLH